MFGTVLTVRSYATGDRGFVFLDSLPAYVTPGDLCMYTDALC
jgi:hypothetical protein